MIENRCHASFVTARVIVHVFVKNEVLTILLNRIICQVHIEVVEVAALWPHVFLSGKPCQTLLVNKDTEGIYAINQAINAQIEFKTVDQVRFVEVTLRYVLVTLF